MLTKASITKKLNASADKAWAAIGGIGRLDQWFPIITTCRVDGSGIGAHRYMTLEGGGEITDRIEEIIPEKKRLVYLRTKSPFPVTYYRGTVEVFDSFDSRAVVVWTVDFESTPEDSAAVVALVKGAIAAGIDGMDLDLQ